MAHRTDMSAIYMLAGIFGASLLMLFSQFLFLIERREDAKKFLCKSLWKLWKNIVKTKNIRG